MRRRTTAILAITSVMALTFTSPAAAADPPELESYAAASTATALTLTLLGQDLAVSHTSAGVGQAAGEDPEAGANGAALLLAGTPVPGDAAVAAPGGPATNQSCTAEVDLAEITGGALSALELGLACVNTAANITDGAPGAHSESGELIIRVTSPAGDLLEPILTPLLDTVEQITTPVLEAIAPLLDGVAQVTQIELDTILNDLLNDLRNELFVLAEIVVAPTTSQASATEANGVVARAGANGVTINLLPGVASTLANLGLDILPSPAPLLTVQLGQGIAEVVRDPLTGEADTSGSAAQLLSIGTSDELGILQEITGQLTGAINGLAIDQLGCNAGNPLADVLCIDLGSVKELSDEELAARGLNFGEGTVGIESSAANIQVLPIAASALGGSVLGLSLASATAAANAEVEGIGPSSVSPRGEEPTLPSTGAEDALPMTLALFAVASAGLVLVRRTRTV